MKLALTAVLLTVATSTVAPAQTIYEGVRYQYGRYNEIYYGGANPLFTRNNYGYLPDYLQPAYTARRENASTTPYPSPYTPYGPGTRFFSPYFQSSASVQYQVNINPQIYSDLVPYEEVGQFGYTIDDARNEAYSHVPRIQTGARPSTPAAPAQPASPPRPVVATDPRLKAIPLLNWAKAEHTRNPALYKALVQEAAKYDPAATAAFEKQWTP